MPPQLTFFDDQVVLRDKTAELRLCGGSVQEIPTRKLVETIQSLGIRGMDAEALPDNIKWKVECGPLCIFILEFKPELRSIQWISPKSKEDLGPKAKYEEYRLATPFVVLVAPFIRGMIQPRCELFFRPEPLRSLDDELYWSNLLNVSPHSFNLTSWVCTQFLGKELHLQREASGCRPGITQQLDALVTHIWGGGFNRSSEHHEGQSCFSKAIADGLDPRVTNVERWQKESIRDPSFVLGVAWKSTGMTMGDLLGHHLKLSGVLRDLSDTSELISALLSSRKNKKVSKKE